MISFVNSIYFKSWCYNTHLLIKMLISSFPLSPSLHPPQSVLPQQLKESFKNLNQVLSLPAYSHCRFPISSPQRDPASSLPHWPHPRSVLLGHKGRFSPLNTSSFLHYCTFCLEYSWIFFILRAWQSISSWKRPPVATLSEQSGGSLCPCAIVIACPHSPCHSLCLYMKIIPQCMAW